MTHVIGEEGRVLPSSGEVDYVEEWLVLQLVARYTLILRLQLQASRPHTEPLSLSPSMPVITLTPSY